MLAVLHRLCLYQGGGNAVGIASSMVITGVVYSNLVSKG